MTAATVLALVERGRIGLTESIVDYLPELAVNDNADVLVHHLLTHTSGWDSEDLRAALSVGVAAGMSEPPPGRDLLEHIFLDTAWAVPRSRAAGELMQYANHNYTLLGEIVRRVTGATLDAAMREYVLEPIGMSDTAVIVPDAMLPRVVERPEGIPHAPGHPDTVLPMYDPLWLDCDDGGSGVHSTVLDYLLFLEMIRNGGTAGTTRVLCRDAIRVMTTDQIPGVAATIAGFTLAEASWSYGFSVGGAAPVAGWRGGTPVSGDTASRWFRRRLVVGGPGARHLRRVPRAPHRRTARRTPEFFGGPPLRGHRHRGRDRLSRTDQWSSSQRVARG